MHTIHNYATAFMLTSVLSKTDVNLPMLNLVFVVVVAWIDVVMSYFRSGPWFFFPLIEPKT